MRQRLLALVSNKKLQDYTMWGMVILGGLLMLGAKVNSQQPGQFKPSSGSASPVWTPVSGNRYDNPGFSTSWSVEELSDYIENFCHVVEVPGDMKCRGYDGEKEVTVPCGIKRLKLSCDTRRPKTGELQIEPTGSFGGTDGVRADAGK